MSPTVGAVDRRKHPRVRFESVVRISGDGRRRQRAVGRDISFGGCSFYVDHSAKLAEHERIEIALTPPKRFVDTIFDSPCRLTGRIAGDRSAEYNGDGHRRYVAVEFDDDLRQVVKNIYRHRKVKFSLILLSGIKGHLPAWLRWPRPTAKFFLYGCC